MLTPADFLSQIFPREQCEAFALDLVRFQIDELNALGDRLRYLKEKPDSSDAINETRARCEHIVEALRINTAEVVKETWRWLQQALTYAEDAFGPALLLTRLGANRQHYHLWLESLTDDAVLMLDELQFGLVPVALPRSE